MVKLQSSTKTAEVQVKSVEDAKRIKDLLSKYGIKLHIDTSEESKEKPLVLS